MNWARARVSPRHRILAPHRLTGNSVVQWRQEKWYSTLEQLAEIAGDAMLRESRASDLNEALAMAADIANQPRQAPQEAASERA